MATTPTPSASSLAAIDPCGSAITFVFVSDTKTELITTG